MWTQFILNLIMKIAKTFTFHFITFTCENKVEFEFFENLSDKAGQMNSNELSFFRDELCNSNEDRSIFIRSMIRLFILFALVGGTGT